MPSFSNISSLSLGNTFGAWYNKTNEIIDQLNLLDVASVTGGDGISVLERSAPYTGGFTIEFSGNVTKNTTFAGNVSIAGTLTYGALNSQMVSTEINLPYASGVTVGNIVYVTSSGFAQKALADDECTAEVVGVVKGICGSVATVATTGQVSGASLAQLLTGITGATFLPGTVYFLSAGTSGAGTTLEPTITDYISKPIVLGITSDTALILPYRGFIANSGYSLGNSTGACGGFSGPYVRTLNGASGDLTAVNSINIYDNITVYDKLIFGRPSKSQQYLADLDNKYSFLYPLFTGDVNSTVSNSSGGSALLDKTLNDPIRNFSIFATSGSTFDVWRLKTIKCLVDVAPKRSFSFRLNKTINRLSCTSFINNENKPANYTDPHPSLSIQFASKLIRSKVNLVSLSITDSADLQQSITNYTVLKAVENNPYSSLAGESIDGSTTGTISVGSAQNFAVTQDYSGLYPIIYGNDEYTNTTGTDVLSYKRCLTQRVYRWDVEPVIVGSGDPANIENGISKTIDALILSQDIDMSVGGSGVTLDMSLLGWNQHYGAVSESLTFELLDFPIGGTISSILYSPSPYRATFFFEFVKFDPNTQVEDQNRTIIPITVDRLLKYQSFNGKLVN